MRVILAIALFTSTTVVSGQFFPQDAEYNPDVDGDQYIGVNDILGILPLFGNAFSSADSIAVENVTVGYNHRCWPDGSNGSPVILPDVDVVYLDVNPYLNADFPSAYETYNCFKVKLPSGAGFKTLLVIPSHINSLTPPLGASGDGISSLNFEFFADNFTHALQFDGNVDGTWGPTAGWHAWMFIRDHNGNWRPLGL